MTIYDFGKDFAKMLKGIYLILWYKKIQIYYFVIKAPNNEVFF